MVKEDSAKSIGIVGIEFAGYEDVYNMEVRGTHNFLINSGIIVHNCMDAVRYFVRTKHLVRISTQYKSVLFR